MDCMQLWILEESFCLSAKQLAVAGRPRLGYSLLLLAVACSFTVQEKKHLRSHVQHASSIVVALSAGFKISAGSDKI